MLCVILLLQFQLLFSAVTCEDEEDTKLDDASLLVQRRNYLQYTQCIRQQKRGDRHSAKVVMTRPGSDLILPCFSCLSPEDSIEIESVWKPSESVISKRTKEKMVDSLRSFVFRDEPKRPEESNWKFEWEYQCPGEKKWLPLTRNHKRRTFLAKTLSIIMAFAGRNNPHKVSVGDRYELIMGNVSLRGPGFYRCVNKYDNLNLVSSLYYIEPRMIGQNEEVMVPTNESRVFNSSLEENLLENISSNISSNTMSLDSISIEKMKAGISSISIESNLKLVYQTSPWSLCSACTHNQTSYDSPGERRRFHECIVERRGNVESMKDELSVFRVFDSIPCRSAEEIFSFNSMTVFRSSLLPKSMRQKLKGLKLAIHQIENCTSVCLLREAKSRLLKKMDSLGVTKVIDYLPVGEYLLSEVLPPLRRAVKRKSLSIYEGDHIVLTCGLLPHEMIGSRWSIDGLNLTANTIIEFFSNRGLIDERGDLVVRSLLMDDKGKYSCYSDEGDLLAAYSIFVKPNDRTQESSLFLAPFNSSWIQMADEDVYEVENILKKRVNDEGEAEYLVKWLGYTKKTWEPLYNLKGSEDLLKKFEKSSSTPKTPKSKEAVTPKRSAKAHVDKTPKATSRKRSRDQITASSLRASDQTTPKRVATARTPNDVVNSSKRATKRFIDESVVTMPVISYVEEQDDPTRSASTERSFRDVSVEPNPIKRARESPDLSVSTTWKDRCTIQ
ncbi:hypothetical protein PRIPAC_81355 [Pristionchus pacificus]|uniref:Uncharacterized protein n=1 Tax=Pristionchus pacificus TaxID=54126 RepID=A0A2A6C3J7_PRIPA|nr:hypothetical protein PRIPAC_81355 [Pristionchus pacificus]|eukprot:PDM72677.1 hypothetical protein PRIPAC_39111 [Pristionchus pacificus]